VHRVVFWSRRLSSYHNGLSLETLALSVIINIFIHHSADNSTTILQQIVAVGSLDWPPLHYVIAGVYVTTAAVSRLSVSHKVTVLLLVKSAFYLVLLL